MLQPCQSYLRERRWNARGFSLLEAIVVVAITMVLVALTAKAMFSALNNYNVASTARNISSAVQLARIKAAKSETRYRVTVTTTTFRTEACTAQDFSTNPATCSAWDLDQGSSDMAFANGVVLATSGITTAAPNDTSGPNYGTDMTFNSRGLLWDTANKQTQNNSCFYLQGKGTRSYAVCTTMVGKTTIYVLNGSTWATQ